MNPQNNGQPTTDGAAPDVVGAHLMITPLQAGSESGMPGPESIVPVVESAAPVIFTTPYNRELLPLAEPIFTSVVAGRVPTPYEVIVQRITVLFFQGHPGLATKDTFTLEAYERSLTPERGNAGKLEIIPLPYHTPATKPYDELVTKHGQLRAQIAECYEQICAAYRATHGQEADVTQAAAEAAASGRASAVDVGADALYQARKSFDDTVRRLDQQARIAAHACRGLTEQAHIVFAQIQLDVRREAQAERRGADQAYANAKAKADVLRQQAMEIEHDTKRHRWEILTLLAFFSSPVSVSSGYPVGELQRLEAEPLPGFVAPEPEKPAKGKQVPTINVNTPGLPT